MRFRAFFEQVSQSCRFVCSLQMASPLRDGWYDTKCSTPCFSAACIGAQPILQRDTNAITCQLEARGNRSYELCVVPHWDPSSAVIEGFDAPTPALLRHAQVASRLRDNGWMVIDHVGIDRVHAPA